jgi:hypothetical protein
MLRRQFGKLCTVSDESPEYFGMLRAQLLAFSHRRPFEPSSVVDIFQSLNNRVQGLAKSIQKGSARAEQCVHALPHELAGIWVVSLASKFQLLGKLIMAKFWQFFGPLFVLKSFVIFEKLLLRRQEIRPTNLKIENTNEHGESFLKGFH